MQVPQGATPRSLVVHLKGELTRSVKPGDAVTLTGIYLTEPYTGFKAMRAGLLTATFMECQAVHHNKQSYADLQLTEKQQAQIEVGWHQQLPLLVVHDSRCTNPPVPGKWAGHGSGLPIVCGMEVDVCIGSPPDSCR